MAEGKVQVILYHHTHWDREWWTTFQQLRFRLVSIVDRLLEILEADPTFRFTLDGQTIVLKDYLQIRPENRERLVEHVRAGRIAVGPWYILPDEFLVSGEAHIRNLWLAERLARELQIPLAPVGYLPDQFGHIGQMPQILAGFGIESAVVWRGFGAPPLGHEKPGAGYPGHPNNYEFPGVYDAGRFPDRMQSEFWWEAPDGTRVLGVWLPLEYYRGHYAGDLDDPEAFRDRIVGRCRRTVEHLRQYATTRFLLEPLGGDHLPADHRLTRILRAINAELAPEGIEYRLGLPQEFGDAVRAENPELKVVWKGEGRAFGRKAHILPGVLSARLYLKNMNHRCQTALERYAEPLQALNWMLGARYEQAYLWLAWERLIENHPHDSICGCSIDQVHREMETRFAESGQVADLLAASALEDLAARIQWGPCPEGAQPLVVFNPLNWERTDEVRVLMNPYLEIDPKDWALRDSQGREIPFQVRATRVPLDKYEPFPWLPVTAPYTPRPADAATELSFVAEGVPGLGYRGYLLQRRGGRLLGAHRVLPYTVAGVVAREKGDQETTGLRVGPGLLENQFLRVEVSGEDGSLTVTDLETGLVYRGLNRFRDGGDAGDTYNYSWPHGDQVRSTRGVTPRLTWAEVGPMRATLRITWPWALPAGLTPDRTSRSAEYVPFELHSEITLRPGVKRVDIRTHFLNTARDHRLQALFPLGARVAVSSAEGPFEVVDRPAGLPAGERGSAEPAVLEHPQQAFVSVSDGARGLTIANRGLPEFSVEADEQGTVALTLLRAVGWLSREDLLARVGGAGPSTPVPDAQMLGPVVAEYAIIPHAGSWQEAGSYRAAHAFNAPLAAVPAVSQRAPYRGHVEKPEPVLPPAGSLLRVGGDLLLTALKKAEDREALIVRFLNPGRDPGWARITPARLPARAYRVNLREEPLPGEDLPVGPDGGIELSARPWQLVTVAIEF